MAALVTLAVAKSHLRITTATTSPVSAEDADIERKVLQASDIILSYLKGRPLSVSSITSSGGVATVTTAVPHALTTNDVVTVTGADDLEYNGAFSATVTSTTTFTFPVSGTPAATATGPFRITTPQTWTDATVPVRVQAAVLLMLTRLFEQRGDDEEADAYCWAAIERLLARDRDPAIA